MKSTDSSDFLKRLQSEASLQARLHQQRFLPAQLDVITSFIGRYPWQVVLVLSGLTAAGVTWW
jgi:hypothetical protein